MIELQIDITDLEDIKSANNVVVIGSIAATAKEVLVAGGRIVLKRSYCNAPDEIFRVYAVAEVFEKDWSQCFDSKPACRIRIDSVSKANRNLIRHSDRLLKPSLPQKGR